MKKLLLLFAVITLIYGCDEDDQSNPLDGSLQSVGVFLTQDVLNSFQGLDFEIYTGKTPPNIEGTFELSPFEVFSSDVPTDEVGLTIADYYPTFSNQNNMELTLDYMGEGGPQTDIGIDAYIIGSGQQFTAMIKMVSEIAGLPVDTGVAFSGTMGNDGINDIKVAFFMIDDKGDPFDVYVVENGQGRVFIDGDGFSPRQ